MIGLAKHKDNSTGQTPLSQITRSKSICLRTPLIPRRSWRIYSLDRTAIAAFRVTPCEHDRGPTD